MIVSELFSRACALAIALGMKELNKLPGCWEHQIDERWWMALNAHSERIHCSQDSHSSEGVPPFTIYFMFNGWPAGLVNANGGSLAAGALANEDALIDAINAAIETAEGRQ